MVLGNYTTEFGYGEVFDHVQKPGCDQTVCSWSYVVFNSHTMVVLQVLGSLTLLWLIMGLSGPTTIHAYSHDVS